MPRTRTRIIRPLFFQSSIVFGVRLSDWKYIGSAAVSAFILAIMFRWQIKGIHLALPLSIFFTLAGSAFFNWVRKNRRPRWLEAHIAHLFRRLRRRNEHLDRFPVQTQKQVEWLIGGDTTRQSASLNNTSKGN